MQLDEWNWDEWREGDKIVWLDDENEGPHTITHINHAAGYVYWKNAAGEEEMTRITNMARVIE